VRRVAAVLSVAALIVLLTWLALRAFDSGAERFDRVLARLDRFNIVEADLHANILSARAGLLRNYDPLVRDTNVLNALMGRLRASLAGDAATEAAVDRLNASVRRQEALTEKFKSNNALLQNSLAYFALYSAEMSLPGQADPLAPQVTELDAAMLHLTLDTSPASAAAVQQRLADLALGVAAVNTPTGAALLAHGQLLYELLPRTDDLLRALDQLSRMRPEGPLRELLLTRKRVSLTTARRFRAILYLISLLLVGSLVYVGLQLHRRARASRRRAVFEHVLSGIAMRFVTASGPDLGPVIVRALAEMSSCVGAGRAYFVAAGPVSQTSTWHQPGIAFPPDWPVGALALLRQHRYPVSDGIVHVPNVARLPQNAAKDALTVVGVTSWACATSRTTAGAEMLLGFDAVGHPRRIPRRGELGLLRLALATIVDALRRQTLEQERNHLQTRLEQARRLESVGALASGIAHNFNNIVGAILGYVEYADEQNDTLHILDEIRRAGERARELVDQILSFARRHDGQRRSVNVTAVVHEALSLLRAASPKSVQLILGNAPGRVMVRGVAARLQQVILNLCNNAAQAMDYVGSIELDIAVIDLPMPRILSHGTLPAGCYARIAVSDSGHGMDEAVLARIFEPFFTTRAAGTGLGLTTTREIVREHGGAMHVESIVDVGTRFEAWLPCLEAGAPGANATLPFGRGESVLLVEFDDRQRLRDEEILAALGYEPAAYGVAGDAFAACEASPERFDLILLAHPTASNEMLALSARLRLVTPHVPILLATGAAEAVSADALMTAGVSDVVSWPIAATEAIAALQDNLRHSRAQEPDPSRGSAPFPTGS
jgi:signal transduction histidine kinase/CheY-like chemotaxis protein